MPPRLFPRLFILGLTILERRCGKEYCPRRLIIPRLRRSARPIFAAGRWYCSRLDLCPVPNLPGDGGNQLEFAPLLFFGQRIAAPRGSKTALRAERKLFERQVVCGLIDLSHRSRDFRAPCLVVIKPSTTVLALGNMTQRREVARPRTVVFKEQPIAAQLIEQLLCNRLVTAFSQPSPHRVATTKMDAGDRRRGRIENRVFGGDRVVEEAIHLEAQFAVLGLQ